MIKCEADYETIDITFSDDSDNLAITLNSEENDPIVINLGAYSGYMDDYRLLRYKPSIDGVTLVGDLTSADLGLVKSYNELNDKPTIDGVTIEGDLTSADLGFVESYDDLTDRPSIDGVTLTGDMTSADLCLVKSYDELTDRPSIDGVTLTGDMTSEDLGLVKSYDELADRPSIDGVTLTGDMTSEDLGLIKSYNDLDDKPSINGQVLQGDVSIESLGVVLSDTYANWSAKRNLISQDGVIYVYVDYQQIDNGNGIVNVYPGVKIGNGYTKLSALPFINSPDPRLLNHIANNAIHVTASDKAAWNGAVADVSVLQHKIEGTLHEIGETTSQITDGSVLTPIVINGKYVVPSAGDVVRYGSQEFMYTDLGTWAEFGSPAVGHVLRGTVSYWNSQPSLISEQDAIYIYTDYRTIDNGDGTYTYYQGMKIGDGSAYLIDIPFIGEGLVTQADIDRWNNKWSGYLDSNNLENLVFTTD